MQNSHVMCGFNCGRSTSVLKSS